MLRDFVDVWDVTDRICFMNNFEMYENGIDKTGYVLEFEVSQVLREHKWRVINNKYYVDDVQGSVRELDLLAYKATEIQGFYVYTTLLISCKKNEKNAWVFISKDKEDDDPNFDWSPLHYWTSDKVLNYQLTKNKWTDEYLEASGSLKDSVFIPEDHIYAFQEMSKNSGNPQNDKNIYSSITSLMKAQNYEINALSERKKGRFIYKFSLISLIDSEMIKINIDSEGNKKSSTIDGDKFIGNYIVDGKKCDSKIHFVKWNKFSAILERYDDLHEHNVSYFEGVYDSFFEDALDKWEKKKVLIDDFDKAVNYEIRRCIYRNFVTTQVSK